MTGMSVSKLPAMTDAAEEATVEGEGEETDYYDIPFIGGTEEHNFCSGGCYAIVDTGTSGESPYRAHSSPFWRTTERQSLCNVVRAFDSLSSFWFMLFVAFEAPLSNICRSDGTMALGEGQEECQTLC